MKLYSVLIKKNKEGKIQDIKLLNEGFSWMAFLFSIFWFLYNRMWKESFALLLISIVFALLEEGKILYGFNQILVEVLLSFVIALNANHWFLESLDSRGYEFKELVFGSDIVDAKMRFLENLEKSGFEESDFDESITNPKLHRRLIKLEKQKPYFAV